MDLVRFGQHVRLAREARGLTQAELAARLGKSVSFVGMMEQGRRAASMDTLVELCKVLACPPSQLLAADLFARVEA